MKLLCVLLSHFPLRCEIYRHPALRDRAVVVTYASGSQKLVLDYSPGLTDLQYEMPLQTALARYGEVELIQSDIPYYEFTFNEILSRLEEKSPLVEGAEMGCAYIGLDGLQFLYKDEGKLAHEIQSAIPQIFAAQMGIAENKFLAYLAAQNNITGKSPSEIRKADIQSFLNDLPCSILPISLKSKGKLRDFGINTLSQAAAMPPGPLQAQFGPEGQRIWDLVRGIDTMPFYPRFLKEDIIEKTTLPSVTVSLDALLYAIEPLLARVFVRDDMQGKGIRGLNIWTRSWRAEHWERSVRYKEPAMSIKEVIARIKYVLETFPQPGPVEQLGFKVTGVGYGNGRQRSLFSEIRAQDHLLEDIKQLETRLGSSQIFHIKEVEPWSRIPERQYSLTPLSQ